MILECDIVIGGGGTMTREAAILGIPSLSFFKGEIKDSRKIVLQGERIFKSKDGVIYDRRQNVIDGTSEALILNL